MPVRDSNSSGRSPEAKLGTEVERLEALADEMIASFSTNSSQRGKQYYSSGRIEEVGYTPTSVFAVVRGTSDYDTCWGWELDEWVPECSCPVGPYCKHAYALACMIIVEGLPAERLQEPWIAGLLPSKLHGTIRESNEGSEQLGFDYAQANPAPFSHARHPRTEPASVRRANRDAESLERLRMARDPWSRHAALAELVYDEPRLRQAVFEEQFHSIVRVGDADMRCWLAAHAIAERAEGRVPPALAPFLDRADLEQRHRSRVEEALIERVGDWVTRRPLRARRNLRLEFRLSEKQVGKVQLTVEARLTSKKVRDEPRTLYQLRPLIGEVHREPGIMPPDQRELLELLLDPAISSNIPESEKSFSMSGSVLLRLLHVIAVPGEASPLASWSLELPENVSASAGIVPGAAVRIGSGSVSIEPTLMASTGAPRVVLEYLMPDGQALNEEEMLIIRARSAGARREPTLILARGAFWTTRGDVPPPIADLFIYSGGFGLSRKESRAVVEPLARIFPRFRRSIAAHTRVHDVRPIICLDLRDDDWLQIRAFAIGVSRDRPAPASGGAPLYEWAPDGRWLACSWESAPTLNDALAANQATASQAANHAANLAANPATAMGPIEELVPATTSDASSNAAAAAPMATAVDSEILLEIPDPARTSLLGEWIESTGATSGLLLRPGGRAPSADDRHVGGWLKLGAQGIDRFASAWDNRPGGMEWYGNSAVRRLFAPATRMIPRLRIVSSGIDWFTVDAAWESDDLAITDADLAKLRNAQGRFVKLKSGWVRKDQVATLEAAADALAELGIEAGAEERVSVWQLARARPEALAAIEELAKDQEALRAVRELRKRIAAFKGLPRVRVPRSIRAELRPYQREGLDFLVHTSSMGIGAVLADDMGLGKTLQALAWLAWLADKEPEGGPSLVVCPASVVHNWEREAAQFAPSLRVLTLTAGAQRHVLRREISKHDLVITNYALLRRDLEELQKLEWRTVILDEAQNIKNPDAVVSKAARALRARHRLALTGTPLENRVLDLWSIVTFLNPGYLGTRAAFEQRFDRFDVPPHARRLLAAKLRPIMLRRLKKQVAPELPPRIEERRDCDLTLGQRKLYLAEVAKGRSLIQRLAASGGLLRNKISILALLTRLRQICCHPALAGGRTSLGSGKFDALFEVLDPLFAEGHKVLVFSQFVECLKLIDAEMRKRGIAHHMLTGQSRNRAELIAAFERDPDPAAFLISLKAGGTGLNLTAASYVILFDPWWNPAVEAQAIDRTHRIGQDRTVIAYRMLMRGTIEERIWDLQQRKASLVSDVLGEDGFAKTLTREDLDYLLAEA